MARKKLAESTELTPQDQTIITSQHVIELGASGTKIQGGYYDEDYKKAFRDGLAWIDTADRMIRSDEQIFALCNDVKQPIRATSWTIQAASDEAKDVYIKEYVEAAILEQINFRQYINDALTMIEFGYSVFEIVHKIIDHDRFGKMLAIKKLGFREQATIQTWNFDKLTKELESIWQLGYGDLGSDVKLPANCLQINTMNKRGDNYEGLSPLRPCYRYFLVKDEAITMQRRGISFAATGIPIIITQESNPEVIKKMQAALNNFLTGKTQGIILPSGTQGKETKVVELKISHDTEKVQNWIDFLDVKMARAFNAGFAELGLTGKSGSLALGETKTDNFLQGIEAIPEMICENFQDIIITLVNWKFGKQQYYPTLKSAKLNTAKLKDRAESISKMASADLVQKSDAVKEAVHSFLDLPPFDRTLIEVQDQKETPIGMQFNEHNCNNHNDNKNIILNEKIIKAIDHNRKQGAFDNLKGYQSVRLSEIVNSKQTTLSQINALASSGVFSGSSVISSWLDSLNGITLAERPRAVKLIDTEEVKLLSILQDQLEKRYSRYIDRLMNIVEAGGSRSDLYEVMVPDKNAFKDAVMLQLSKTSVKAKDQALKELGFSGVKLDEISDNLNSLPKATKEKLKYQVAELADSTDSIIKSSLFQSLNAAFGSREPAAIRQDLNDIARRYLESPNIATRATNYTSEAVNSARNDVWQTKEVFDGIAAFRFTNPDPISAICISLNGQVFSKDEYNNTRYLPPLHPRCKSIIEPIPAGKDYKYTSGGYLQPIGTEDEINKAIKSKVF